MIIDRLARLVAERSKSALLLGGLLFVLGLALATIAYPRLTASLSDYHDPASEVVAAQQRIVAAGGGDAEQGYALLVDLPQPIGLDSPVPDVVSRTVQVLRSQPEVLGVVDYATSRDPSMISRDGRQTFVVAAVALTTARGGEVTEKEAVAALRAAVDIDPQLRDQVTLGGTTVANVETAEIATKELGTAETLIMPILLLGLLVVFRGFIAASLPLLGAVFTVVVAMIGLATAMLGTTVSIFAMNLVTALGMGLAIDFSLLLVMRFREQLALGVSSEQAIRTTMETAGRTVGFSVLVVTATMCGLLIFPQQYVYSIGLAGLSTALAAGVYALVVLPAILKRLGTRVNAWAPALLRRSGPPDGARWYHWAHRVMRRPLTAAVLVAGALLAAGLPFTQVTFTGIEASILPADSSAGHVYATLRDDFEGAAAMPVTMTVESSTADQRSMTDYAQSLGAVAGVASAGSPVHIGANLWSVDVRLTPAPLSQEAGEVLRSLEAVPAPGPVAAVGETARFRALLDSVGAHLPYAIVLIFVLAAVLIYLMTGSVVLPVKNFLMTALSIVATLGILVVIFQWGWLGVQQVGSLEVTTIVLASVLVAALSTDYGIFLLHRIKEERDENATNTKAVAVGLQRTGPVVSSAAALMVIPFAALCFSSLAPVRELGAAAALTIVIDATIVRAVLVPALMALLGRANWWAPGFLRRSAEQGAPRPDSARQPLGLP